MTAAYVPKSLLAKELDIQVAVLTYHAQQGHIPKPAYPGWYTVEDAEVVRQYFANRPYWQHDRHEGYLSRRQVAKLLNTTYSDVWRSCSPPTHQIGKRYYYAQDQVPSLLEQLKNKTRKPSASPSAQAEAGGLFSQASAARALGMPAITLSGWIKSGRAPTPTHKIGSYVDKFFDKKDLAKIKKLNAAYFKQAIKKDGLTWQGILDSIQKPNLTDPAWTNKMEGK